MNVAHLLTHEAQRRADSPAIIERSGRRGRSISFAQLESDSARAALMLRSAGIGAGDPVLVFLPMSIDLYVALIALFRIGAVATFVDPSAGLAHIARCCELLPPRALIASSRAHWLRLLSGSLRRIPRTFSVGWIVPGASRWASLKQHEQQIAIQEVSDEAPALVTFTSGSTGQPKAAVRSHGFLARQHAALQRAIALKAGEIDLATLPIFTLANLASGVCSIIPDANLRKIGSVRSTPIVRQIERHRPTRAVASPAFFERLLADPAAAAALQRFEQIYTGGAPVFPGLLAALQRAMPQARIVAVYGSTEAEPIAEIAWHDVSETDIAAMLAGRGLLAGAVVPEIELRIIRGAWGTPIEPLTMREFDALRCAIDEPGEIVVSGPHVLRGYLHGIGDAAIKFNVDGAIWHRTGDAGYLDPANRLWLLGRCGARIEDEHGEIYPFAVECAASAIACVRRSALVRSAHGRLLVIEPDSAAAPDLQQAVHNALAWAHLHEVLVMRRIPVDRRHNAKIDYTELNRRLQR